MAHSDDLLEELVASSHRIEALMVASIEGQTANMPPGWSRRFGAPVTAEGVNMALGGSTPGEVAEHMREHKR